ncbi:uncharacterized protein LOC114260191 isoform X2 [Camellia sinensis]|uniref:uncharacterized protein LOC114260191 isoform X2 n=1 Tax=Camellia sinensis TaxID=4442 RepID=UPI001035D33D|nr:uncharacterized protein LOC114260191 isoform X2 [Camellia sinensis]
MFQTEMHMIFNVNVSIHKHSEFNFSWIIIFIDYQRQKQLLPNCGCSLKRSRKFQPEDRLFSLSSVTSPATEEHVVGRDGGILANGQGKPKKGRGGPRDAKRIRQSNDADYDYEDDPDLIM